MVSPLVFWGLAPGMPQAFYPLPQAYPLAALSQALWEASNPWAWMIQVEPRK